MLSWWSDVSASKKPAAPSWFSGLLCGAVHVSLPAQLTDCSCNVNVAAPSREQHREAATVRVDAFKSPRSEPEVFGRMTTGSSLHLAIPPVRHEARASHVPLGVHREVDEIRTKEDRKLYQAWKDNDANVIVQNGGKFKTLAMRVSPRVMDGLEMRPRSMSTNSWMDDDGPSPRFFRGRHVSFGNRICVSSHDITPYGEIYGRHPLSFHFTGSGEMIDSEDVDSDYSPDTFAC
mmetsp:Transcript_26145/g.68783  ORF Transcript_26145/g.68783 Transcript_26145/m.68783 type:complete len:233 (-) Transcript_26145:146-844(-)